jgi:two-component system cell cycle response regulator CpdR
MNGKARVLLVEDEKHLLEMTAEMLELAGMEVDRADSAGQALVLLERKGPPDMLITDHAMPGGMTGLELAAIVLERYPGVPVVLVSGFVPAQLPPIPEKVKYLPKPYRLKHLLAVLAPLVG